MSEATPQEIPEENDFRRLDDYVDQLEDIFTNIEGMLACKDLDSLERQTVRVHMFLLKMAVSSLGAVAGEFRERRAVDEALPRRATFLDRRGRTEDVLEAAGRALVAHDPLGEEVREPWATVLEDLESEGFEPRRVALRPWMPRPVREGDLPHEVEELFLEIRSVALLPFLVRDHRPHQVGRERLLGLLVLHLRQEPGEAEEKIRRNLARLKTVGEVVLANRLAMEGLLKKVATFRHQTKGKSLDLQGSSPSVGSLQERTEEVARAGVDRLRLEGPVGAGKKHVAELFHRLGPGAANPFVAVDCAHVAAGGEGPSPSDYEFRRRLFGDVHAEDLEDAMGAFEQARGGTLYLDAVENLPLSFQYKLAQVLQEGRFSRLGEDGHVQVDCRIILASDGDLEERVEARRFSSKLLRGFRNAPRLRVSGLNHRREDIPALAETFFAQEARSQKKHRLREIAPETLRELVDRDWSDGNVKALMNWIGWAVARAEPDAISLRPEHLPRSLRAKDPRWSVELFHEDGRPRTFAEYLAEGFRALETSLGDRARALQAWDVSAEEVEAWLP
jgi:DNA-binding NtrC family response regulator